MPDEDPRGFSKEPPNPTGIGAVDLDALDAEFEQRCLDRLAGYSGTEMSMLLVHLVDVANAARSQYVQLRALQIMSGLEDSGD